MITFKWKVKWKATTINRKKEKFSKEQRIAERTKNRTNKQTFEVLSNQTWKYSFQCWDLNLNHNSTYLYLLSWWRWWWQEILLKGFRGKIENVFNSVQFSNDNTHFAGRGTLRKVTQIRGQRIDNEDLHKWNWIFLKKIITNTKKILWKIHYK